MPQLPFLAAAKDSLHNQPHRPQPVIQQSSHSAQQGSQTRSHPEHHSTCLSHSEHINIVMAAVQDSSGHVNVAPSDACLFEASGHANDAFKVLHDFYVEQEMCDVEIKVGNQRFKCHRVVLACISLYFRAMFKSDMAEAHQESIPIQDLDEHAMEDLIEFAYTSRIRITTDNVQSILFASSILQIESVAEACANFMKSHLHPSNCLEVRNFAELHNRVELVKMSDEYILENFCDVAKTDEFFKLPVHQLGTYIASDYLNVDSESFVYEAVMKWIKQDLVHRREHLPWLMSHIRLAHLSLTYVMETVEKEELVRQSLECRDFLDEVKYFQMSQVSLVPMVNVSQRTRPRLAYAGVLFCVGGRGATGDPFRTVESYDPRRNKWFQVAEMNTRRRHVGVCSVNGLLYAVGGHDGSEHLNSGEVFNPKTNKWRPIAPMGTLRRGLALASVGGPVYAVGGLDDTTCFNTVERYDPSNDSWTFVAAMLTPRGGVGLTALKGHLYAIGGNDGTSSLDKCESYDPLVNKWTPIASMHKRRAGAGCSVMDGFIYVVGGFDDNSPLDSVECYSPSTNQWTLVASMGTCRGGVGLGTLGRRLYAVGGHDSHNYLNTVEAYDADSNRWEAVQSIQQFRAGAGVAYCHCLVRFLKQRLTQSNADHLQCV